MNTVCLALTTIVGLCAVLVSGQFQNQPPKWVNTLEKELTIDGVKENQPKGFSICCFKADDPNGDSIKYTLGSNDLFQVEESTGNLTLLKPLDREENSIITLRVFASDGKDQISLVVQVTVLDVNDHDPLVLPGVRFANVSEAAEIGDTVYRGMEVVDYDAGQNALLTFECAAIDALSRASCPVFGVRSNHIQIAGQVIYEVSLFLKQKVDYEFIRGYIVTVNITDRGKPSRTTLVNIALDITNVQDSPPIWVDNPINANVNDSAGPATNNIFVDLVAARDRDGAPREVEISIIDDPDDMFTLEWFEIDMNKFTWVELQLKKNVDREVKSFYEIKLRATEKWPNGSLTDVYTDATARVTVLDLNDQRPTFEPETMSAITIQEGLANRSEVPIMNVRDLDTAPNGKFSLTLTQPYPAFAINPPEATNVANLRLSVINNQYLDYETPEHREQVITIVAKEIDLLDKANGPYSSTATVTIKLTDTNDNYPVFERTEYLQSVAEDLPKGSSVLRVKATDKDAGVFGQIQYSLEGAESYITKGASFAIDSRTGVLTLNKTLNYEIEEAISMFAVARDGGGLQTSIRVLIQVVDVNDESPVFTLNEYVTQVNEKDTSLTMLPEIIVLATDTEANAQIRYSIISGNPSPPAFQVNMMTGKVSQTRAVTYDETPSGSGAFLLNISASDSGQPPKFGYTTVRVNVYDVNDNPPTFKDFDYRATVSEIAPIGFSVLKVEATDVDSGVNGEVIYRITNGSLDHFTIDSTQGVIRVGGGGHLDYDLHKNYRLTVAAEDRGSPPLTGSTYVYIDVNDANNKSPYFPDQLILAKVPTNARSGHTIVQLRAIDADTNADLEYRMIPETFRAVSPDGSFYGTAIQNQMTVDVSTGRIYLIQSLDTQGASEFRFTVSVQDNNAQEPPIQRATANVVCTLYKETGDLPEFNSPWTKTNPIITLTMQEEEPKDTIVTTLIASDPRTGEQLDGFKEVPGSDPEDYFRVAPDTGQIILNKRIDYDTISTPQVGVVVEVTAKDGRRSARANVLLNVQDINDNNPLFLRSEYEFQISENKVFPSQVGVVQARDADRGQKYGVITYSISGKGSEKFNIDPNTGFINVARGAILDREVDAQYDLLVIASNEVQGEPNNKKATSVRLVIKILDENDVVPHFDNTNYTIYAIQTAEAQSSLGRVHAEDEDESTNGEIFYSIHSGDQFNLFYINPATGEIRSRTKLLNYARVHPYTLLVHATDNGFPTRIGKVPVYIYIQDLQAYDGRPKFQAPLPGQIITIMEDEGPGGVPVTPGRFVVKVVATDNDGPDNLIRFSFLTGNEHADHQKFTIDPVSGEIRNQHTLDREVQESYNLLVLARDQNTPPAENTIVVLVRVLDRNDSMPSFYDCNTEASDPLYASVRENLPPDQFVTRVVSCDKDTGANADTYHRITCGNEDGYFQIELLTGVLTTTRSIDREATPQFSLCVRVSNDHSKLLTMDDKPIDKRETTTQPDLIHVKITIIDEDDNGPSYAHFPNQQVTIGIPVVAPFGSPVIDARVVDPDGVSNSIVRYEITDLLFIYRSSAKKAPNMFTLGEVSGIVRTGLASYSDYAHGHFEMRIRAQDQRNRPSTLTVFIYILSQNERLKFVFNRKPDEVRETFGAFSSSIQDITNVELTVDNIRYSVGDDANFDYTRTDVCFYGVHNAAIIDYKDARTLLNDDNARLEELYTGTGMERIGLCTFGMKSYTHWTTASFWWIIIIVGIALIVFAILCIIFICCMWRRYDSYMNTEKGQIVSQAPVYVHEMKHMDQPPSTLYVILGDEQPAGQPRTPNLRRAGSGRPASFRHSAMYAEVKTPPEHLPSNPTTPH